MILNEDPRKLQVILDHLTGSVGTLGMFYTNLKTAVVGLDLLEVERYS